MEIQTGIPGLVRDTKTGVVKNVDVAALEAFKRQRSQVVEQKKIETRVEDLEATVKELREIVDQIKLNCKGMCRVSTAS
jgi:uncharacterized Ntn-hydrolase superfamily protein